MRLLIVCRRLLAVRVRRVRAWLNVRRGIRERLGLLKVLVRLNRLLLFEFRGRSCGICVD